LGRNLNFLNSSSLAEYKNDFGCLRWLLRGIWIRFESVKGPSWMPSRICTYICDWSSVARVPDLAAFCSLGKFRKKCPKLCYVGRQRQFINI
jgi:hypothetical protein